MRIKGWKIKKGKLHKEFKFKNFKKTLKFINKVGKIAEKQNHHPEVYFTWGKCIIELHTHSEKKITERDFILAEKINKVR